MHEPTRDLRRAQRVAVLAALALLVPAAAPVPAQSAAPVELARPAQGAASVIAPAATVVRARATATSAQPAKKGPALGRVVGTMTDGATGEPLVGGQVAVKGLPLGNVTDDAGSYFINNVPLGKQVFTVEYLGYESQSKEHNVQPGDSNTLDFALNPVPIEGEEVVVEEEVVVDLSEYVAKTPPPAFAAVPLREMEVEESDTTLMEDWHRAWRNFSALHSIEYPMMGERVYFRRPPKKKLQTADPATAAEPAAPAGSTVPDTPGEGESAQ
jgi:hypothetical protein